MYLISLDHRRAIATVATSLMFRRCFNRLHFLLFAKTYV